MKFRNLLVVGFVGALVSSSFATYTARLYFENVTKGTSNTGQLNANVGDQLAIHYSFARNTGDTTSKWGSLQITLCDTDDLGGILLNSTEVANWVSSVTTNAGTQGDFALKDYYGPNTLYDNSLDASDNTSPLVCNKGVYVYLGIKGSAARSSAWDVKLFTFTVKAGTAIGSTLNFSLDARNTGTGLSTRILDNKNANTKVTDNFVKIVPEPGSLAAAATGLIGLLALRRRK